MTIDLKCNIIDIENIDFKKKQNTKNYEVLNSHILIKGLLLVHSVNNTRIHSKKVS